MLGLVTIKYNNFPTIFLKMEGLAKGGVESLGELWCFIGMDEGDVPN